MTERSDCYDQAENPSLVLAYGHGLERDDPKLVMLPILEPHMHGLADRELVLQFLGPRPIDGQVFHAGTASNEEGDRAGDSHRPPVLVLHGARDYGTANLNGSPTALAT